MAKKGSIARREFLTQATATAAAATELTAPAAEAGGDAPAAPEDMLPTDLDALERAVEGAIAGRRIGRPVFVRYTQSDADRGERTAVRLARMTRTVRQWVGQPPTRLYVVGSAREGPVSLTVQFRNGASALLSVRRGKSHGDGVDLLVIGNHGAIHYDSATASAWDGTATYRKGQADAKLIAAIERALRSGRPETLDLKE